MKSNYSPLDVSRDAGFNKNFSNSSCLTLLIVFLFLAQGITAQVNTYVFSQSTTTYTPLSASRTIAFTATTGATGDPGLGDDRNFTLPAGTIPFNFTFDGVVYTGVNINTNGFITFGATLPTTSDRSGISNATGWSGSVAARGGDLSANTNAGTLGEISYEVLGSAPNRQFVIQYARYRRFSSSTTVTENFNFQIVLNEAGGVPSSQSVDIIYGTMLTSSTTGTAQVGLRGPNNTFNPNVNNRQNPSTAWNASIAGTVNTSAMRHTTTVGPASGQVFTFTPPPPPVTPPNCATGLSPANLATGVGTNAVLSWTAATGSPLSYDVYFGTSPTPPLVGNQVGLTYTPPAFLAPNTQYYWQIVPKNGNGDAVGCAIQSFTTGAGLVYCSNILYSSAVEPITSVSFSDIANTSGNALGTGGSLTDFTSIIGNVTQGGIYSLTVKGNSDGNFTNNFRAYFDWNQDGDFADAGESLAAGSIVNSTGIDAVQAVTNITIPMGATLGQTRMRIKKLYSSDSGNLSDPCTGGQFGQTEDYTLNIAAMPTDTPDYYNLQFPANATILAGNAATIYGQVYEPGLTDTEPGLSGQAAGIEAWVGVSPIGSNTNPNTWTSWTIATHNAGHVSNNDEYQANIGSTLTAGTYYYATRFRLNGGPFVYGGFPNGAWDGVTQNSGVLTVDPNPTQCAAIVSPANGATNVTKGTVAITWAAPGSGPAPTSYDVFFGTTSGSLTLVANDIVATTFNANAAAFSTTYYWRVVPNSPVGGEAAGCSEWSFTTEADPFAPYCSAVAYTSAVEPITSVNFAGIDNQSPNTVGPQTTQPPIQNFISVQGNVTTESTYVMTLKGNTDGTFVNNFRVFIDWNQDGDLNDAGEVYNAGSITTSTGLDAVQAVSNIAVPANALAGSTRMRVKKLFGTTNLDNPCLGGGFGQTEDYTLNVTICTPTMWYADADGDTYGDPAISQSACNQPIGYVADNTDCNDGVAAVNPGQSEVLYDGVDNNCDSQLDEGFQLKTKLLPSSCGVTLASINSLIGITTVSSAITGYRIKVTNGATVQIIERNVPHFTLPNLPSYDYATTYTVEIELQRNGVWLGYYGDPCLISSPAVLAEGGATQVNPSQCGITLPRINTLVATTSLAGATGYRFKVTNITPGASGPNVIQTIDRTQHWFSLVMLTQYNYNSTYRVEVAVKTNGAYSGFGAPCEVTSPGTQLINCGDGEGNEVVIATPNTLVAATSLQGAMQYRFQITRMADNATTSIDRNVNYFTFNMVPGYSPGVDYAVRVAVMTVGTWSPFGDACIITSPGAAARYIPASETTAASDTFKAVAYPNPFASAFAIDVTSSAAAPVQLKVYDMTGRLIETRDVNASDLNTLQVGDGYPSGIYNVIVTQGDNVETLRVIKR